MEILTTKTGKMFDCDMVSVIPTPPRCYLYIHNTPLVTIAEVFSDENETMQLTFGENLISGFNRLQAISVDNGTYRVTLRKE